MTGTKKLFRTLRAETLEVRRVMTTYFIDASYGDNSNTGLSETAAFRTVEPFAHLTAGDASETPMISLLPGDELVFLEGQHDFSYESSFGNQSVFLRGIKGTAQQPVKLTARPGARLNPAVAAGGEVNAIYILQSEYIHVRGFDITAQGNGILVAESSNIQIVDNFIHDVDGEAHHNMAGVHLVGVRDVLISDNFFANNFDRERLGNQNNRHVVAFGSTEVVVSNNLMWNERQDVGAGIEYKHLGGLGPNAQDPFAVTRNVIINANGVSIGTSAPNSLIRENLIIDSGFITVADRGGTHQLSNEVIEWNTIVNTREDGDTAGLYVGTSENPGYPLGEIQFNHNVVHDTRDYSHSDRSTMNLHRYGDDNFYERLVSGGLFLADGNVYDTVHEAQFDVFGSDIRGNEIGFKDTFGAWQALGFDSNGIATQRGLNELFRPLETARPQAGWLESGTAKLSVLSDTSSLREGESTSVQLIRSGVAIDQPLTVHLSVNVDDVEVPAVVTIPAGEQAVRFDLRALNDERVEPSQGAQIIAKSCIFDASTWIQVVDVAPVDEDDSFVYGEEVNYCVAVEPPSFAPTDTEDTDRVFGELYGPKRDLPSGNEAPAQPGINQLMVASAMLTRADLNPYTGGSGERRFVVATAGDHEVYFDTLYGGTPTSYARDGQNVIASFPGLGFGGNVNTGQDGTQASANGIAVNPIAQLDDPTTTALYNYYSRETDLKQNHDGSVSYSVRGFLPNFWQSHEKRDDAIPLFPNAQDHNWITGYHANAAAVVLEDPTVPVVFEGSVDQPIGYNFLGNELLSDALPWNQRLMSIPEGRVAFKTNISLAAAADDAWAGIRFRTQLPTTGAADIHDAYKADGYSLNVNKFGDVQLLRLQHGLSTSLWSGMLSQLGDFDANSIGGVLLEVRTHNSEPGWMQVAVNGRAVAEVNDADPLLGEHNGLVASTTAGRIRFGNREFYDVGYEHLTTYTLRSDGNLDLDMQIQLAEGVTAPRTFYRVGQHAYVDPSLFAKGDRMIWGEAVDGRVSAPHFLVRTVSPTPGGLTSLWVGNERGDLGLSATVRQATLNGETAVGTHALIQDAHDVMALHLNTLPESANFEPILLSSTILSATFGTRTQSL